MNKKKISVKFVDFWDSFIPEKSVFYNILSERYDVVLSDTPDYLFFSVFGDSHLDYDCIKIFYTGENQTPDFNLADYAIGFDVIDFGDRYFRLPNLYLYGSDFKAMEEKVSFQPSDLSLKEGFCSFVYSNNNSSPERRLIFESLNKYKPVSSGGRYMNNIGGPVQDKLAFQSRHKFSIAFENCSHRGYTTEKLIQSFAAQTIPIYWGDPDVCSVFNRDSFVNASDYDSFEDVVKAVEAIDLDDSLYMKMMQTPALLCPEVDGIGAKIKGLTMFLYHIFDQEQSSAYRYSRVYWCRRYSEKQRFRRQAYRHSFKGLMEYAYKRILWKHSRDSVILWKIDKFLKKLIYAS